MGVLAGFSGIIATCKGKCCIYHITSLVPGGIFRLWASTCTRPEKWYSIQCLLFVWAHRWLAKITDIDFTLLLINLPAKFSASWDSCKVHFTCNVRILFSISCDRATNLCLCIFSLSLAKHTKKGDSLPIIRACLSVCYSLSTVSMSQASAENWKVQLFASGSDRDSLLGNAAAALRLW